MEGDHDNENDPEDVEEDGQCMEKSAKNSKFVRVLVPVGILVEHKTTSSPHWLQFGLCSLKRPMVYRISIQEQISLSCHF